MFININRGVLILKKIGVHSHVHFIGIGGISMSALAHILLLRGNKVSGSDRTDSDIIKVLRSDGAKITIGQKAENIENPDLVVYTAAIAKDNPELVEARNRGIETVERAEFLGELMKNYDMPVSVSGTHGKTTTTSMLSCVLLNAKKDPTVLVGGELDIIGGNYHVGNNRYLIFEGCEYVDSFLKFNPFAAVILNIEKDHLDYFSGIEQIKSSFNKFMCKVPKEGFLVVNADDKNVMDSLNGVSAEVITFGDAGDFCAKNISFNDLGYASFDVEYKGEIISHIDLSVGGKHNVANALAVFAAAAKLNVSYEDIAEGIKNFRGAKRRFEFKGEVNGAKVYDDYAHHPTEISATFDTAQKTKHNKIWVVFQPHTYSRTNALFNDFVSALSKFDRVIVTDIYAAREKNTIGISSKSIADKIDGAKYISEFDTISDYLKENVSKGDIVITMGAGTVTELSEFLFDGR